MFRYCSILIIELQVIINSNKNYLRLHDKNECNSALSQLVQSQNETNIEFILKTNEHRSKGVALLDLDLKLELIELYKGGKECGEL